MRKLICFCLIVSAAHAGAAKKVKVVDQDQPVGEVKTPHELALAGDYTKPVPGHFMRQIDEHTAVPVPTLGPVRWFSAPVIINGKRFVAHSGRQLVQDIIYDDFGTAYLYVKRGNRVSTVQISKDAGAAEGSFEYNGWTYILSRGQVMGMDDSPFRELFTKLGPADKAHIKQAGAGLGIGTATALVDLLLQSAGLFQSIPWAAAFAVAGGAAYAAARQTRFGLTHMQLKYAGNRFANRVQAINHVEDFEYINDEQDVLLTVKNKDGSTERITMSSLERDGKLPHYRHEDCVSYLVKVHAKKGLL